MNIKRVGGAAVCSHHPEEGTLHVWTRIYQNPSCRDFARGGVLENAHHLVLQAGKGGDW